MSIINQSFTKQIHLLCKSKCAIAFGYNYTNLFTNINNNMKGNNNIYLSKQNNKNNKAVVINMARQIYNKYL